MQEDGQHVQPGQYRWRQAFAFGLPLALLELGLVAVFNTDYEILQPLLAIMLGLLLYLVVTSLAGYWFCQHAGRYGIWAGVRVGLVGATTFLVVLTSVFTFLWIRYVNTPRLPYEYGIYDTAWYLSLLVTALGLFTAINGVGVLLSVLGGWLGGLIAHWRPEPGEQPGEQRA